ncbi:methyltransferase type 11 [Methanosarcina sp. A14]|uniref:Phosphatidylethanolamine N-methyltransferase n=2 Tax=Methanosarcina barkeri TaxID=2208 RepID=A0A0E3LN27_METBA|nr:MULTISPECIES: class I SAM-dependent methyltransferase [Methanosarcina]AKB54041.1 Phosphatidylethanolamine N-methyltransferase [Methanosarcina barkeri MS]AKJ38430.1 SAM-dependent methyltransferase [Methanosarcina barkeri CM1]OED05766.1 methyltransferase type 11 [Methanosarcina sp. A14]
MSTVSKYNRIAPIYELIDLPLEFFFFREWRKEALSGLSGKILEVGVGTGRNLKYYPAGCRVIGIDKSERMLRRAQEKAESRKNITLYPMDAERLEFPDNSFDYVVITFVLCTIPDPVKALKEMRRVLKPSGELIALEHVHSDYPIVDFIEHLINPILFFLLGDHATRHTVKNIEKAGFTIKEAKKLAFKDVFRKIRAKP